MLPVYIDEATYDFKEEKLPSKDFALEYEKNTVNGIREGLLEIRQAVYFILNTERYQYLIYPWSYGVELRDLIGKQMEYVIPEIERRITEALLQDDRIDAVNGFEFEQQQSKLKVTFIVHTNIGNLEVIKVVNI